MRLHDESQEMALMNALKDKVVIITGGSSGARVLITGRRVERFDEAMKDRSQY